MPQLIYFTQKKVYLNDIQINDPSNLYPLTQNATRESKMPLKGPFKDMFKKHILNNSLEIAKKTSNAILKWL